MRKNHPRHQAIMIADDMGKQQNCALAMRHTRFLERATTSSLQLEHIVEMPLFVRSELSEGVQLADLCGYSVYRAFRSGNLNYSFFQQLLSRFYGPRADGRYEGLKLFPPESPLHALMHTKDPNEKGSLVEETKLPLGIDVRRVEPYQAASSTGL